MQQPDELLRQPDAKLAAVPLLRQLRVRIALLIAATLVPVLSLALYNTYLDQQKELAAVQESDLRLAQQIAETYRQVLERARDTLLTSSQIDAVRNHDQARCSAPFGVLLQSFPQYTNLVVADPEGNITCSGRPIKLPLNVASTPSFARAVETRGFAVGNAAKSRADGRLVMGVALPTYDDRGNLVAVVQTILSVEWLNELAKTIRRPADRSIAILDQAGNVVVRYPDPEKWIGRNLSESPIFQARLRGETRIEAEGVDGVRRHFALVTVAAASGPMLYVSVGVEDAAVLHAVRERLFRALALITIVAAAAFGFAWFGTQRVVARPVHTLLTATRRVAAGDLAVRTEFASGTGELQRLAQAFNHMAQALQEREDAMRRGTRALADQEALLRTVLDTLPVGVWVANADGDIVMVNEQARAIRGGPTFSTIDEYCMASAYLPGTERVIPANTRSFARALRNGEITLREVFEIDLPNGGRRTLANWAVPIRDTENLITGAIAVDQDITNQQRAEMNIRELNATLERRVAERTAELQFSNRQLEAFSYSVSHDLRAPLRAINGYSVIIAEEMAAGPDTPMRRYLERIRAASMRMADMIDGMIALARVSRIGFERRLVDLSELAAGVIADLQELEPHRQVRVTIMSGATAYCDKNLARAVLQNLLGNAWKYTARTGDAHVEFGFRDRDTGERVYFVRDNGAGFDMAHAAQLFKPFSRLHSDAEFPGSGIGLATVSRIVQRHGGWIEGHAALGEGALFEFTLGPRAATARAARGVQSETA